MFLTDFLAAVNFAGTNLYPLTLLFFFLRIKLYDKMKKIILWFIKDTTLPTSRDDDKQGMDPKVYIITSSAFVIV